MGNDEFIEIAARYDRLAAHELLWRPVGKNSFDLCTTRGLKMGSVYMIADSWVASMDGQLAAFKDRSSAMDLLELTLKVIWWAALFRRGLRL